MAITFGTDGWRAIIGEEFTFANVEKVAQAYSEILGPPQKTPIPIGYDRRSLSDDFAKAFACVLVANRWKVLLSETYCPTPCISWMTKTTTAPGGVVITASHNPYQWNGVKFKESYGGSAAPEFTGRIEEKCAGDVVPRRVSFESALREGKVTMFDPRKDYVAQLRSRIDLPKIKKAAWKIAYDPLYGAGAGFLDAVLEGPVREIHGENNATFGGLNPEPIARNLEFLTSLVTKEGFDVGLATDGDADRIGAVSETGAFVNPHQIFALILNHLIERGERGGVVKTVSTTSMIDKIAAKHGLKVHETPIGFKHICQKFQETSPLIGGEESGGIGIPSHVYERDGLLSGLLLLEIMSVKKKKLGEILKDLEAEIGPFRFVRDDVRISEEQRPKIEDALRKEASGTVAGRKIASVNRLDGTKYVLEDGSWLLLRLSGTEPLVRVYAEAPSDDLARKLVQEGRKLTGQ
ncbi:MAG TPA: phosphoglucomutase/phosphomannomutase family protein [bacterium]|nr:phosphoglucomutase/phosphomannomutase family protein [bacterium]